MWKEQCGGKAVLPDEASDDGYGQMDREKRRQDDKGDF